MTCPSLEVLEIGPYVTVQDCGRPNWMRYGLSRGGAVDGLSLEEGRLLVGNEPGLAVLEFLQLGGKFRIVDGPVRAALTGAIIRGKLDDRPLPQQASFLMEPNQVLEIGKTENGNFGYLSVFGGIKTSKILGSRSTQLRAGFGGLEGRCLKVGDVLPVGEKASALKNFKLPPRLEVASKEIRILWGSQAELFSHAEREKFMQTAFRITHELDRMGARLESEGEPIHSEKGLIAISDAIALGDIQVPGDGIPIVLLADRQPTGGYPRIATIIAADIYRFVQSPIGKKIHFSPVSEDQAIMALQETEVNRRKLSDRLMPFHFDPFKTHNLLSKNLISGIVVDMDLLEKDEYI